MAKINEGTRTIGQRTPTIAYTIGERSPQRTPWIDQRSHTLIAPHTP
jgi:hypothetical protein